MKKRFKIIVGLGMLLLIVFVLVPFLLWDDGLPEEKPRLSIWPGALYAETGVSVWYFSGEGYELIDEKLLGPLRKKYALTELEDQFSRCPSPVSYELINSPDQAVFDDWFYYGHFSVYSGCEYEADLIQDFRIYVDGSTLETLNEEGVFIPFEEWLKSF